MPSKITKQSMSVYSDSSIPIEQNNHHNINVGPATRLKALDKKVKEVSSKIVQLKKEIQKLQNEQVSLTKKKSALEQEQKDLQAEAADIENARADTSKNDQEQKKLKSKYDKKVEKLAAKEQELSLVKKALEERSNKLRELYDEIEQHEQEIASINQEKEACNKEITGASTNDEEGASTTAQDIEADNELADPIIMQECSVEPDVVLSREHAEQLLNQGLSLNPMLVSALTGKPGDLDPVEVTLQQELFNNIRQRKIQDGAAGSKDTPGTDKDHTSYGANHDVAPTDNYSINKITKILLVSAPVVAASLYTLSNYMEEGGAQENIEKTVEKAPTSEGQEEVSVAGEIPGTVE
ncbi:MAG: hypothetical protein AB8U25_07195 [Rickettsiales endosymbiont of Dermacentor nuttalli]